MQKFTLLRSSAIPADWTIMKSYPGGRQTVATRWGDARSFTADDDSSIFLEPGPEHFSISWMTNQPAVPAIKRLIAREFAHQDPEDCLFDHGPERPGKECREDDWHKVWDKFSHLADTNPASIHFVRVDFPTLSVALCSLGPKLSVPGISYGIMRHGAPLSSDIESLRKALDDTAADSIKPEINWILESINS